MLMYGKKMNRGDTLIEVLFAITIFSSVAIGSLAIMNQGSNTAQRSLEITQVRQYINGQTNALRFLNASYVSAHQAGTASSAYVDPAQEWISIETAAKKTSTFTTTVATATACVDAPSNSFIINPRTAKYVPYSSSLFSSAPTYAQLDYNPLSTNNLSSVAGLWIQAISYGTAPTGYIDFHINSCWIGVGESTPLTISTIVRLYEPRG